MRTWPLSTEEIAIIRSQAAKKFSILSLAQKYSSKIEEAISTSFTHKCICPNFDHKQGGERTPSFYFSEQDKTFKCFGCQISGDLFDFIALVENRSIYSVLQDYVYSGSTDFAKVLSEVSLVIKQDNFDIKHTMCLSIRDYIISMQSSESYNDLLVFADHLFKKIDDRFLKMDKTEMMAAKNFALQISVELERKKEEINASSGSIK